MFWNATPIFWLSDGDAIKAISANRKMFPKDVEAVRAACIFSQCVSSLDLQYETLNIYGPNMVGTEGSEWKRHRSVANSAFNEVSLATLYLDDRDSYFLG
jgi:cytochrome P450